MGAISIGDTVWGTTLGELGLRGFTGDVAIEVDGKAFRIALREGFLVDAVSPLSSDTPTRIATNAGVLAPSDAGEVAGLLLEEAGLDELDAIARVAGLDADQLDDLASLVISRRVARTFAIDRGGVELVDVARHSATGRGIEVGVRGVIYLGARTHLSAARLARDLKSFGTHFALAPNADLTPFGFGEVEDAVIATLRNGASLGELEAAHRDIEPRLLHAIAYALASCSAVVATTPRASASDPAIALSRLVTPITGTRTRALTDVKVEVPREPDAAEQRAAHRISQATIPPATPVAVGSTPNVRPPTGPELLELEPVDPLPRIKTQPGRFMPRPPGTKSS